MNKNYYIDQTKLVLLKNDNGLIYQYSFLEQRWYGIPELQELLDHLDSLTEISEEEANNLIKKIETMIKHAQAKNKKR